MDSYLSPKRVFWILTVLFTGAAVVFSLEHRHLYSDGSYQLLQILHHKTFFHPQTNRILATLLNQSLTVSLLSLGTTDIEVLSWSFGFNHHLMMIGGLVLSYCFIGENKVLFIFPLCSFLLIYLNHSLQISIEPHMSAALIWPCFLLIAADKNPPFWKLITSWLFILCLTFSYEGNFILLFFLGLVMVIRQKEAVRTVPGMVTMFFILISFGITFYGAVFVNNPVVADNRSTVFLITNLVVHPAFWGSAVALICLLYFSGVSLPVNRRLMEVVFILACIFLFLYPIVLGDYMLPQFQHRARSLNLIAPFLMGACFLFYRDRASQLHMPAGKIVMVSALFVYYQWSFPWNNFRNQVNQCLQEASGVIEMDQCEVAHSPELLLFSTNWTRPYLSILFQAIEGRNIRTVINSSDYQFWQYWDAQQPTAWPDLSAYDIYFEEEGFP